MNNTKLYNIATDLENFEASESRARTGTGSRREGEKFEIKVLSFWDELANCISKEATAIQINGKRFNRISHEGRQLYLPTSHDPQEKGANERKAWFETSYSVSELLNSFPGLNEVISRYAPPEGQYKQHSYPEIYRGLTTRFDGTIVCVENGVLVRKILLEYKTGKASNGQKIDGNAHERLSFQIMQYLEIAPRYPQCSLAVFTNGAFIRYRNKYHPLFNQQADRLSCFKWFDMKYYSYAQQYIEFARILKNWLLVGECQ